jgi:cob(I)alamin adenosyltransferase
MLYTKKGDSGYTCTCGKGRVGKEHACIELCGEIDELNSFVGMALCQMHDSEIKIILKHVQRELFELGADLATPLSAKAPKVRRIGPGHTKGLEAAIAKLEKKLKPIRSFIIPGGSQQAAVLHVCRAVCRRAERSVVRLSRVQRINKECIAYLNRLSALFFGLALLANARAGVNEEEWKGSS